MLLRTDTLAAYPTSSVVGIRVNFVSRDHVNTGHGCDYTTAFAHDCVGSVGSLDNRCLL